MNSILVPEVPEGTNPLVAPSARAGYFDHIYAIESDPFGVTSRWYEQRKMALLLAALDASHYDSAYEPGCGIGELTIQLAPRCGRLLASDASEPAVIRAKERTSDLSQVEVRQQRLPADWPKK
jgi:hypothetical protein